MSHFEFSSQLKEVAEASIFIRFSRLKKRNITVGEKKTSVTLEPLVWELLHKIADEQSCHANDLCTFIADRKHKDASLASAIRIFIMSYMNIQFHENKGNTI
jgi:predicted DNA-binding ribbon-helix-helix protein